MRANTAGMAVRTAQLRDRKYELIDAANGPDSEIFSTSLRRFY
jgi:hypothetical protein